MKANDLVRADGLKASVAVAQIWQDLQVCFVGTGEYSTYQKRARVMGKANLFNSLESRLGRVGDERCEQIAHAVIFHLWRRMPFLERERISDALAPDIRELLMEPKSPREAPITAEQLAMEGPIEKSNFEEFCREVRYEAKLAGDGEGEEAIHAVFAALKSELPVSEVKHIHERLPGQLNLMWATA